MLHWLCVCAYGVCASVVGAVRAFEVVAAALVIAVVPHNEAAPRSAAAAVDNTVVEAQGAVVTALYQPGYVPQVAAANKAMAVARVDYAASLVDQEVG